MRDQQLQQLAKPSRLTVVLVSLLLALPVVIFWLWLVILPVRVAILCPEECQCETEGRNVECDGTSLTAVPFIHLTAVRRFWFSKNKIKNLVKDSFVSLTELDRLYVGWCGLRTVELGAFNGLTKLTQLTIRSTEVFEIIPGTFENMISLERLMICRNKIEHVDRDMFSGLFKLKYIDLSENKLQYLHPEAFLSLQNLQRMDLNENPVLHIPTDRNFIKSHSLSHLEMLLCNVSSVSVETFANVSSLEWLDLSYNKLRTVDINMLKALPKLSALKLNGNPLHCDCQLQEVWRWCEDRNMWTVFDRRTPKCETPIEVKGIDWWVLENGQCLEGNVQFYGHRNNTRYNSTEINYNYDLNFLNFYELPVCAVLFIFGTTGNVIILIIIICNKDMRTVPNLYILNLATSNIIYLTELVAESYANLISDKWLRDDILCWFFPFCRRLSVCLSAYSVALLSIQHYRVIVNSFHVRVSSKLTWRGTVATIFGVWIVAALIAVPSAMSSYLCAKGAAMTPTRYYQRVVIFELLTSCVLPLCVIAFSYIMTVHHFVQNSRSISEETENPQLKTRRIAAKILVVLTVVFLISYVPYHVFLTYIIWTRDIDEVYESIRVMIMYLNYGMENLILTLFLSINSCLNPVVLLCTCSPIRQHFKRYLTCFCKTNSFSFELKPTRKN